MKAILKPGREKPFVHRHPWVFSGALKHVSGNPADGDELPLYTSDGSFVAWGLFNSHSQIRLRLYSWRQEQRLDEAFFRERMSSAIRLRDDLYGQGATCRLVNSEGDGLSGLTVDRYGRQLVVQLSSLALARRADMLLELLCSLLRPKGIVLRTDNGLRKQEGLEPLELTDGAPQAVEIVEHGLRYMVSPTQGQKTGFYLDQRDNRLAVRTLAAGRRCLDVCCYTGGFALNMAAADADSVTAVDVSEPALETARANAELNRLPVQFHRTDAFAFLKQQVESGERFGCIVLDPPKFAGGRDTRQALKGYISLNELALRTLEPDGFLLTCSCSGRVSRLQFRQVLSTAAHAAGRQMQFLSERGASADHPVMASCPESDYLKCLVCRQTF
ncbi:MAG: class I SAM-dependent rRNA methyltransferase [Candidatus Cloacimonetes bacterium]|nr:class I SAM-dependent rRNA methyltransferase [Candidatus Cloacimonadota bacterium]